MIEEIVDMAEVDDELKERICGLCEDVVDLFDENDAQTEEALQVLTSLAVTIICNHFPTRDGAIKAAAAVTASLTMSIGKAEEMGAVEWIRNRAN